MLILNVSRFQKLCLFFLPFLNRLTKLEILDDVFLKFSTVFALFLIAFSSLGLFEIKSSIDSLALV